jgi:hypothetical protein
MACQVNNTTHFENKEEYSTHCSVCQLFVKIYKYRSCEDRLKALEAAGEDVFKSIREAEQLAAAQTGRVNTSTLASSSVKKDTNPKDPKKASRRGR